MPAASSPVILAVKSTKAVYKTWNFPEYGVVPPTGSRTYQAMTEKDTPDSAKSSIWGGRFSSGPSQLMQDINASIDYDKRL